MKRWPRLRSAAAAVPAAIDLSDEEGIREAYAAHGGELYRFAVRQLRDEGAAQDVVQEVFVRAWRSADGYNAQRGRLRPWLFAIARNIVIDHVRRHRIRPAVPMGHVELAELGAAEVGFDEVTMTEWVVEEAMRRIAPEHRVVLVETYLRGRSYAELSTELGVPVGTLRSRAFYGLKALRLVMDEMGVEL